MAKILIVEDDAVSQRQIGRALTEAGHSCAVLDGGEGVLSLAHKDKPDLLILDVMMPDVSGFEVCRTIRSDPELYRLPVVFVSAMDGEEEIRHGLAQGADAYVTKPVDMKDLVVRVNAILEANKNPEHLDDATGLSDAGGSRRELQRWLSTGKHFSLIYAELLHMRRFVEVGGVEGRNKAIRHLARALTQVGTDSRIGNFFAGHMGGGCFLSITPIEKAKPFCERVHEAWAGHVKQLYVSLDMLEVYETAQAQSTDILDIMFCITNRSSSDSMTVQQLLDILSRIRNHAIQSGAGGIHIDRRIVP